MRDPRNFQSSAMSVFNWKDQPAQIRHPKRSTKKPEKAHQQFTISAASRERAILSNRPHAGAYVMAGAPKTKGARNAADDV